MRIAARMILNLCDRFGFWSVIGFVDLGLRDCVDVADHFVGLTRRHDVDWLAVGERTDTRWPAGICRFVILFVV